jgi:CubicO group peptidase (beta-lactamase class C family)
MKILTPFYLICLSIVSFSSCSEKEQSENKQVKQLEKFVSEMNARGFNIGNILVYENGEVIFESADGLRTIDPVDSLTLESQFRLASVSKQFTGVAIMKLKQAGKLDYEQKVNTLLTDFPYDNITIRHLLHHTSGLPDYEEIIEMHFVPQDSTKRYLLGNDEILKIFFDVNPDLIFQPGEEWEYSNTGYMILASIVEKVSGQHFRDFLRENIFEPVGMSNTILYNYQEKEDPEMPNRVFGYQKALNQKDLIFHDYDIVNDVRGDGGIYSTLEDLFKWNMALVNYEVLPQEYMEQAWSWGQLNNGEKTRYGFGWKFPEDTTALKAVYHAGGWVGFGTFLYNEIETKSGYIVLTNDSWESFIPITDAIDSIRTGAPYLLQKKSIGKEMAAQFFSRGLDTAIRFYTQNKADSNLYSINVYELNNLGFELLDDDYLEEALLIFKLNTEEYASIAGTYASYADALLLKGDSLKALDNFNTAYEIDSSFTYAKEKMLALEAILE